MTKTTYQKIKPNIYRCYFKNKRNTILESIESLKEIYDLDVDVIMKYYDNIQVKSKRNYILINCLIFIYLKYAKGTEKFYKLKISDFELLNEIKQQLSDKGLINLEFEQRTIEMIRDYLVSIDKKWLMRECNRTLEKLKRHNKLSGYTARIVAGSICYHALYNLRKPTIEEKHELMEFFHASNPSIRTFQKVIKNVLAIE